MWRSRSLEEWETKKSYLIRSLFEDLSISSTIFEGHESASLSFPSNFVHRAESPLPELIIELEPKKPNLHDDPEELYDALAKEMRRLYRKDFLDIEFSTSSSENSSSEIFNSRRIYDNVTSDEPDSDEALGEYGFKEKGQIDYDATEHQIDNDTDSTIQTDRRNSKESSETTNIASESLILQVHVHSQEYEIQEKLSREQQEFIESKRCRLSGEDSPNVLKTANEIEPIQCEDDDTEDRSDSENFATDTNASSTDSSINFSRASPEIMRQRQPFVSCETPPYPVYTRTNVSQSNNNVIKPIHLSMEVDSKEFSEDVLTTNHEIKIAEGSDNETILFVTSTPTRKRSSRFSIQRGQKRRLVSYSSSSLFASVANAASQTSFSDCEIDWCNFWSNFFVGMPTVYNVCSCDEHVCST